MFQSDDFIEEIEKQMKVPKLFFGEVVLPSVDCY